MVCRISFSIIGTPLLWYDIPYIFDVDIRNKVLANFSQHPTGKGVHPPFHQLMGPNQSKLKSNMVNLLNKIETM